MPIQVVVVSKDTFFNTSIFEMFKKTDSSLFLELAETFQVNLRFANRPLSVSFNYLAKLFKDLVLDQSPEKNFVKSENKLEVTPNLGFVKKWFLERNEVVFKSEMCESRRDGGRLVSGPFWWKKDEPVQERI